MRIREIVLEFFSGNETFQAPSWIKGSDRGHLSGSWNVFYKAISIIGITLNVKHL